MGGGVPAATGAIALPTTLQARREAGRDAPVLIPMRQNREMPDSPLQPVDNSVSSQEGASDRSGDPGAEPEAGDSDGGTSYECPRCGAQVVSPFYGPCETCRGVLRATITTEAEDVGVADYEPKMNVTPNAVATKD